MFDFEPLLVLAVHKKLLLTFDINGLKRKKTLFLKKSQLKLLLGEKVQLPIENN